MHRDVRHSGAHMKELGLHLFGRAMINVVLEVNHQGMAISFGLSFRYFSFHSLSLDQ